VIVVSKSYEPERLQARALKLSRGREHLRHAMDGTRPGVEGDLDKVACGKLGLDTEQAASDGKRLKFCTRTLAAFGMNRSRNRSIEMYSGRTPVGVGLGEMGHSHQEMCHSRRIEGRLLKRLYTLRGNSDQPCTLGLR
jgi:hypothetical protein